MGGGEVGGGSVTVPHAGWRGIIPGRQVDGGAVNYYIHTSIAKATAYRHGMGGRDIPHADMRRAPARVVYPSQPIRLPSGRARVTCEQGCIASSLRILETSPNI